MHSRTLFLDEIGDMTPATQTEDLLRVLQSGLFERVGGNQPIQRGCAHHRGVRNKPLEQAVAARQFREESFTVSMSVRIHISPLRERRDDIPLRLITTEETCSETRLSIFEVQSSVASPSRSWRQ